MAEKKDLKTKFTGVTLRAFSRRNGKGGTATFSSNFSEKFRDYNIASIPTSLTELGFRAVPIDGDAVWSAARIFHRYEDGSIVGLSVWRCGEHSMHVVEIEGSLDSIGAATVGNSTDLDKLMPLIKTLVDLFSNMVLEPH